MIDKSYWKNKGSEYTSRWHNYYLVSVSSFLDSIQLSKRNTVVIEYGSYDGKMIDYLLDRYPYKTVVGVDFNNITNHPNIIETDINDYNTKSEIELAINDLIDFDKDAKSKLMGRRHAVDNLIHGGYYIETSKQPTTKIHGLSLIKQDQFTSFFIK